MRVHLVAPTPHRDLVSPWEPDAYVGKALRLGRMLVGLGHDVFVYGGPRNDIDGAHPIVVVSDDDRRRWFGDEDWSETVFNEFDPLSAPWRVMNSRTAVAMAELIEDQDIIFLTMGTAQAPIRQAFPNHVVAESGVGYEGVITDTHRCYESEAWRHYIYGRTGVTDGRWFDTVIPNAFDPDDYIFGDGDGPLGGYLLFMGRLTERKGLEIVRQLAQHHKVITAGQGEPLDGIEHHGVVRGQEKSLLLSRARAVLCPTSYIEPFGGVAVEAMLSGTPVVSSPFGAFSETVANGISGYRCHTLDQFLRAVDALDDLDPKTVREWAMDRFTLAAVAPQYDRWLHRLNSLYDQGWYQ